MKTSRFYDLVGYSFSFLMIFFLIVIRDEMITVILLGLFALICFCNAEIVKLGEQAETLSDRIDWLEDQLYSQRDQP